LKSTVVKREHIRELGNRITRGKNITVNNAKLVRFTQLWSVATPKADIMKELKIKKVQYYNYLDASEELVDDFLLGFVDHGLVLLFRERLISVGKRAESLARISQRFIDKVDKANMDATEKDIKLASLLSRTTDSTEKLYNDMLDDSKIVNQTMKTINRVIVKSSQVKGKRED